MNTYYFYTDPGAAHEFTVNARSPREAYTQWVSEEFGNGNAPYEVWVDDGCGSGDWY